MERYSLVIDDRTDFFFMEAVAAACLPGMRSTIRRCVLATCALNVIPTPTRHQKEKDVHMYICLQTSWHHAATAPGFLG